MLEVSDVHGEKWRCAGDLGMVLHRSRFASAKNVFLGAVLLASPGALVAQHGGGGGFAGGGLAGGGGLSGVGHPSGLDTKDDLKDFHATLALQASSQQIAEYELMLKSTQAASADLQAFSEQLGKEKAGPELSSAKASLDGAIEKARSENKKFLDGFSEQQKSGLKEIEKKLAKADSDLAQQIKELDEKIGDTRPGGQQGIIPAQGLGLALTNFQNQQVDLGGELSISQDTEMTAFQLAALKSTFRLGDQTIGISTTGSISKGISTAGENTFKVDLIADLAGLQQNLTEVLGHQLNRNSRCGENIAIQNVTLTSSEPDSVGAVQLHFERWSCFGGTVTEMAEGNGTVSLKLNLVVGKDGEVRVESKVERIQAEGLVGELLRSGSLVDALRDKLAEALSAAARQGADFKTILPAAASGNIAVDEAEFQGTGAGKVIMVLQGEIRVSDEKASALIGELKQRAANGGAVESVTR
jgi:hypothetical protein